MTKPWNISLLRNLADKWPKVADEYETVRKLMDGCSISRYGDGEFKMIDGYGYSRESPNGVLGQEMLKILRKPQDKLLVGIPTMDSRSPKYENWLKRAPRMLRYLRHDREYHSAFISRPDSSPWIDTREFCEMVDSLWRGKHAAVVSEPLNKGFAAVKRSAREVTHIECPSEGAYAHIDKLASAVKAAKPDIAILSCGPTATCMASRLCAAGIQAIDIGSIGKMLLTRLGEN